MHGLIEINDEGRTNSRLGVSEDWHRWCRLCAKVDIENINIFSKVGNMVITTEGIEYNDSQLSMAIDKYFDVEIKQDEELPVQLCTDCFSLITFLINFNERVIKVQQLYASFQHFHDNTGEDLQSLRVKYGILEDDQPHEFKYRPLAEINFFEHKLEIDEDEEQVDIVALQDPNTGVEVKMENSIDDTLLMEEDVCEFEMLEDSFGSDILSKDGDEMSESSSKIDINDETNSERKSPNFIRINASLNKNLQNKIRKSSSKRAKTASNVASQTKDVDDQQIDKPYTCVECSKVFKIFAYYRSHMEREHAMVDVVSRFFCSECSLSFNTSTKLRNHRTKKHLPLTVRQIIPCPYCEQKFSTKTSVGQHIKFVHMHERPVICEECGAGVRTNSELKKHMLQHTDYAPFECEICKKCFKNEERLKKHLDIHSPTKHICPECGLQLNSRTTLNNHLVVHSDVRQYKCDYCGRAFKRAKELKNHLILHTGLKPYSCDFCDKTFANASNSRAHKRKAHPEEVAALDASGEKAYTKNVPKLAVLKSVVQAAENLTPVVPRRTGPRALGGKSKLPPDTIGAICRRKRKIHKESIVSTSTNNME